MFQFIQAGAQTRGLIYDPATGAGQSVLDPNLDGYTSASTAGFIINDETESEIPYMAIPMPSLEPTSDLGPGPDCGFTDFVDSGVEDPALNYMSAANNWLFRLRMGGTAPNSKGYSILVDADQKFGFSGPNADPNAVAGNPGFEFEINFQSNFGVYLYDVDGTTSPVIKASFNGHGYYQKSIAVSNNCGDPDYFYDFYIPFSAITTAFPSITLSTPLRLSIVTEMNPNPAIGNNALSDAAGIDDTQCNYNYDCLFQTIVDNYTPCSAGSNCTSRTLCPIISAVASGATTVSGTSSEAAGTLVKVFKNGTLLGTTTVALSAWTLSAISPALASGDIITATATASGKGESVSNCATTTVGATCSSSPTVTCSSAKGLGGNGPTGAAPGTVIRIYSTSNTSTPLYTTTTDATNAFVYNCNAGSSCSSGPPGCFPNGNYYVTAQEAGKCESPIGTPIICIGITGGGATSATPVISTSPISSATTTLAGTGVSGATIIIMNNNTAAGNTVVSGTSWSKSGLSFTKCQSIQAVQIETGKCASAATTAITVTDVTSVPVITGSYCTSTTVSTVSGTSSESSGTTITVYSNGTSVGTTTVNGSGVWSLTGLSIAPGAVLTAKATNSTACKSLSAASASATVTASSTATATITGPVIEGATSISGTCTSGAAVKVYMDGALLGTAVTTGTSWTLSGLTSSDIYAGGNLSAAATTGSACTGASSTSVAVQCNPPSTSLSITPSTSSICSGTLASITVNSPQAGIVYQLYNGNPSLGGVYTGTSKVSTGSNITLTSSALSTATTFYVKAIKVSPVSCGSVLTNTSAVSILVSTDPSCTMLPVVLLSATIQWKSFPLLDWVIADEKNNRQFIIERSTDNKEYTEVGIVSGRSTGQETRYYSFVDHSVTYGERMYYYRLWQEDENSIKTLLRVFVVSNRSEKDAYIDNSTPGEATLHFSGTESSFSLYNAMGQTIFYNKEVTAHEEPYTVSLIPGFYTVSFQTENGIVTNKVIVKGNE
ncbi:MAG TPA: T9SS type A sorting domain-containing protein [Cytophagaceae bacterium]|nr:T9SS type A sorting domain-containing protein [Cytophagaceae bacterium]